MPISDYRKYIDGLENLYPDRPGKRRGTRRHMKFSDWMLVMAAVGFEFILIGLASSSFELAVSGGTLIVVGVVGHVVGRFDGI